MQTLEIIITNTQAGVICSLATVSLTIYGFMTKSIHKKIDSKASLKDVERIDAQIGNIKDDFKEHKERDREDHNAMIKMQMEIMSKLSEFTAKASADIAYIKGQLKDKE